MSANDSTADDVGSWMTVLARNWWVILGLVLLGAVVGALLTLASPKEYTATATVYIGQTTDANGNPMAGLNSNVKASTQLISSQAVLSEAARRTGMGITASRLRREITVETPSQTIKTTTSAVNLVVISVTDTKKVRATAAANALAEVLLERIGGGVDEKIALLEAQLIVGKKALSSSVARSVAAQQALAAIARGGGTAGEKAAAAAPYMAIVQAAATQQEAIESSLQKTELVLLTAKQVEQPRILHEAAVPDSPSGPDIKLNVAAGALAGLVIGVFVAFARQRLTGHGAPDEAVGA
ncbi:MAG: Wzz/FepE/Etk N-terminal domain-containing protein [Actinobacteria bacterium]|nr:Wzz/FepE/Etk N-terminal domain-containing protein [Actinomycetota bacterium]